MIDVIISQIVVIALVILFVISFTLFIRRLLVNSTEKVNQLRQIEKKLDQLIELMEKQNK
ncbi:MAG: DUF4083 family protein [Bacillaceae bacterium]|nr:DUF4083 family protein [Bacillaceae bacterium]